MLSVASVEWRLKLGAVADLESRDFFRSGSSTTNYATNSTHCTVVRIIRLKPSQYKRHKLKLLNGPRSNAPRQPGAEIQATS